MDGQRAILFATDPPYLVDYDGSNHPGGRERGANEPGITWDDASQGPALYEGFIRKAVAHAILPNAAWYCWHASRRQATMRACPGSEQEGPARAAQCFRERRSGARGRCLFAHLGKPGVGSGEGVWVRVRRGS